MPDAPEPALPGPDPLDLVAGWPVHTAAAGYLAGGSTRTTGTDRPFPLASVTKQLATVAVLVAVEEGTVALDEPAGAIDGVTSRSEGEDPNRRVVVVPA